MRTIVIHLMTAASYYFFVINTCYLMLVVLAYLSIRKMRLVRPFVRQLDLLGLSPPISVIVPAFNESAVIVDSVKSLLRLHYAKHEVVVVNDGSTDNTIETLIQACFLVPALNVSQSTLSDRRVRQVYKSKPYPNLTVIDKDNGGKADSLNVGIELAAYDHVCAVDADSILDEEALLKVVAPFIENPDTVAAGGTIRVGNGSEIRHSRVVNAQAPRQWIALLQIVEYVRSFFCGRVGWNYLDATLIISGAFGLFRKDAVMAVGGYRTDTVGEDMDLIVRLHRHFRARGIPYSVIFLPDPVCWTEVPCDWKTLYRQRKRWQVGLLQSLWHNRDIFMNRKFGLLGMIAFPYIIVAELLGPVFEVLAYFLLFAAIAFGIDSVESQILFLTVSVLYGASVSLTALLINEIFYPVYKDFRSIYLLTIASIIENLGYRQLTSLWRFIALVSYGRGKVSWGVMTRKGMKEK